MGEGVRSRGVCVGEGGGAWGDVHGTVAEEMNGVEWQDSERGGYPH